jgi:arylsulfatase
MRLTGIAGIVVASSLLATTTSTVGARQPRLLLLVTVDTLRADRLGAYGSRLGLTPNLDRLAEESVVFTHAFAPASSTRPSIAAMMTSRYPEELGVTSNGVPVPKHAPRLGRFLLDRGWATGAVVSNYVLRRKAGLARGFQIYDARVREREGWRGVLERRGKDTTDAALRVLDDLAARQQPVFLWVHYQDTHGPYVPPESERARTLEHERSAPDGLRELPLAAFLSGEGALPRYQEVDGQRQVAFYRAGYNGEVAVVDAEIGRLLDGVARRRLIGDAAVLMTADHGESLGEEDYWFAHGERIGEALVHVPLMVRVPGRRPERRQELASLLDVFPTFAALAGGQAPPTLRGRDLLSDAPPASVVYISTLDTARVVRRGIVGGGFHYVRWEDGEEAHEQLFRLDGRDDRAVFEPAALRRLRGTLIQERAALAAFAAQPRPRLSAREIERLSALGYVAR